MHAIKKLKSDAFLEEAVVESTASLLSTLSTVRVTSRLCPELSVTTVWRVVSVT